MSKRLIYFLLLHVSFFMNVSAVDFDSNNKNITGNVIELSRMFSDFNFVKSSGLVRIAKDFVKNDDFLHYFGLLPESMFKNELRRQYFLKTKGKVIDKVSISFAIFELLNAGLLDEKIKEANQRGDLDLSNFKIFSLEGLTKLLAKIKLPLKTLDLSYNYINFITKIDFSSYLGCLEKLNLSNNNISEIEPGAFNFLVNLEFIDLGQNNITYLPKNIFLNCSKLKKIDISDNSIREFNYKVFLPLKDSLEKLNLVENFIKNIPKDTFNEFKRLKAIYF